MSPLPPLDVAPVSVSPPLPLCSSPLADRLKQPSNPLGYICILEARGGTDKKADGHRGDTLHLCQGFIDAGWACWPMFYSDAMASHLQIELQSYDAVLPRINPGRYDGVTTRILEALLVSLSDFGVTIFAHPHAMNRMGAKDSLVKIRNLELGKADTFCYRSREEIWKSLPETLAKGSRVLKQNRGSQGEGIWVVHIKPGQPKAIADDGRVALDTILSLQEAADNHAEEKTLGEFMDFCKQYVDGNNDKKEEKHGEDDDATVATGLLVDQQFLPRIAEGEIRLNMALDKPLGIVLKTPVKGGISATLSSGAKYEYAQTTDERYTTLMAQIHRDLPRIMPALGMDNNMLPLLWTIDVIRDSVDENGQDTYTISEFNCSCVGITQQLHLVKEVCDAGSKAIQDKQAEKREDVSSRPAPLPAASDDTPTTPSVRVVVDTPASTSSTAAEGMLQSNSPAVSCI